MRRNKGRAPTKKTAKNLEHKMDLSRSSTSHNFLLTMSVDTKLKNLSSLRGNRKGRKKIADEEKSSAPNTELTKEEMAFGYMDLDDDAISNDHDVPFAQ